MLRKWCLSSWPRGLSDRLRARKKGSRSSRFEPKMTETGLPKQGNELKTARHRGFLRSECCQPDVVSFNTVLSEVSDWRRGLSLWATSPGADVATYTATMRTTTWPRGGVYSCSSLEF